MDSGKKFVRSKEIHQSIVGDFSPTAAHHSILETLEVALEHGQKNRTMGKSLTEVTR